MDADGLRRVGMCRGAVGRIDLRGDGRAAHRTWCRTDSALGGRARTLGLSRVMSARLAAGEGLLQAAVRTDRPAVLRQLLEMSLDPDERTQIGHHEDQTFSTGGPLLEAVNTGRIEMARVLLQHGADPNAQVFTSGSPTAAAYHGGSPRRHAPDPAMIDLMLKHGGWIDAASVGYLREVEVARRMLAGELDPHLEFGTFSGQTVAEQILWSGASGRSPDIVRMA